MKEEVLTGCAILPSRLERIEDNKMDKSIKRKRIISIIIVAVLLATSVIVFLLVGKPLIQFVSDSDRLRAWVDENWLGSRLAYIGMVVFQIVVAIIPGEPFEIAAGYAFGAVEGTVICVLGSTIGGTLVFLLVKKFGVKLVEVFIPMEKIRSLKFLQDHKKRDIMVFLLFFIPGTPKDALSYFAGLTDMDVKTWLVITMIAKLPSIITSTVGGNAIGTRQYLFAIVVFGITILISGVGLGFYNHYTKKKQAEMAITEVEQEINKDKQKDERKEEE